MSETKKPSEAILGSRRFPDVSACLHCGAPIRMVNWAFGSQTEHYDPDASFRDSTWKYCRVTMATWPDLEKSSDPGVGDDAAISTH